MSRDRRYYLEDIARSCEKIQRFTAGMTLEAFLADERTYDAVVRNLEILGEAAKRVPDDTRIVLPGVEWKKAAGMRDMLAHAYFGIDNNILWDVIQNKLPPLYAEIKEFLDANPV